MASFSAGTTFTDGVANDVTAAKLGALVNNATPTSGLIQDRTTETIVGSNDTLLLGDASDSNNLKKMTVANVFKSELTGTINSTSGTITTATIPTLVATTLVTTGTGTAASPAIVPTGDTNTGIFFPAADTIAFSEGGTESVRIDSSGNVGIGTTSPATKLTVSGTNGTNSELRVVSTGVNTGGRVTLYENTSGCWEFATSGGANSSLTVKDLFNNTERLRIDSSGNVGINTSSPDALLDVKRTNSDGLIAEMGSGDLAGDVVLEIKSADSRASINIGATGGTGDASRNLAFSTSGTERLRIDSSGNVGIGVTSPVLKLHVDSSNPSNGMVSVFRNTASTSQTGSQIQITQNNIDDWAFGQPAGVSAFAFWSGRSAGVTGVERLRIDSSGRVGIGMTPASLLDISKSDNTGSVTDYPALRVTNTNSTQGNGTSTHNYARIDVKSGNGTVFGDFGTRYDSLYSGAFIGTESSHPVIFQTGGTERLRIDSSGFVSIGTATGLSALHVHGNVTLSNTTTATSAGTGGLSKPATYAGYLTVSINGTSRKIPYYAT